MKRTLSVTLFAWLLMGCNNSAETKPGTEMADSAIEVTFGNDSMEEAETRGLEPGGLQPKSDTLKDNLKVSFPDKKK